MTTLFIIVIILIVLAEIFVDGNIWALLIVLTPLAFLACVFGGLALWLL